jgi:adenylate cyclase
VNEHTDEPRHTFVFADMAGFTALTEVMGDEEAVELAHRFSDLLRVLLSDHGAEEVKTIGDAMMIYVAAADQAVELGLRIVDELGARPRFPIVRVGMHTGPAIERGGDWFGATVNLAARISGAAGGNEVLLSEATQIAAGELDGVELSRHGQQELKNIREPVTLFRAEWSGRRREELPIDPVCRMALDPEKSAGQLRHEGKLFYFCSLECIGHFAADPDRYSSQ